MSYGRFMEALEADCQAILDEIPTEQRLNVSTGMRKQAEARQTNDEFVDAFCQKHGISRRGYAVCTKIAQDLAETAMRLQFGVPDDKDYLYMMKSAGVRVEPDEGRSLVGFVANYSTKVAQGVRLTPEELIFEQTHMGQQVKMASTANVAGEAAKNLYPYFGKVGRWAAFGLPIVGTGAYIKGRMDGSNAANQAVADALFAPQQQAQQPIG